MNRPLSDYRLGRIIIWPFGRLAELTWFFFCAIGTAAALIYAWIKPGKARQ
jgi:hypothetical protein